MTRRTERRAAEYLATVSEKRWQDTVISLARSRGYLTYHTHDSRRCAPGFPDLIMVSPAKGRLVIAELKTVNGATPIEQDMWLKAFAAVSRPPAVYVWRPGDLQEIGEVLGVSL